jgi:hypothetical protein
MWIKVSRRLPRRDAEHLQYSEDVIVRVNGRELLGYFDYTAKNFFHTLDHTPGIDYLVSSGAVWKYAEHIDMCENIPIED